LESTVGGSNSLLRVLVKKSSSRKPVECGKARVARARRGGAKRRAWMARELTEIDRKGERDISIGRYRKDPPSSPRIRRGVGKKSGGKRGPRRMERRKKGTGNRTSGTRERDQKNVCLKGERDLSLRPKV